MIEIIIGLAVIVPIAVVYIAVSRIIKRMNKVYPLLGVVHPQNREKEDN